MRRFLVTLILAAVIGLAAADDFPDYVERFRQYITNRALYRQHEYDAPRQIRTIRGRDALPEAGASPAVTAENEESYEQPADDVHRQARYYSSKHVVEPHSTAPTTTYHSRPTRYYDSDDYAPYRLRPTAAAAAASSVRATGPLATTKVTRYVDAYGNERYKMSYVGYDGEVESEGIVRAAAAAPHPISTEYHY